MLHKEARKLLIQALEFILGNVSPTVLEALLLRQLSSIRPGRNFLRGSSFRKLVSFSYRIA